MIDEALDTLAKRVTACKQWRWMPGMLCIWPNGDEWRVGQIKIADEDGETCSHLRILDTASPNLEDPATIGCLEALVMGAYDDRIVISRRGKAQWSVHTIWLRLLEWDDDATSSFQDALVSALEEAEFWRE
jgi:hypothetical protein